MEDSPQHIDALAAAEKEWREAQERIIATELAFEQALADEKRAETEGHPMAFLAAVDRRVAAGVERVAAYRWEQSAHGAFKTVARSVEAPKRGAMAQCR